MEDITTEEMFADVPHEDYVQNPSSLPSEGKGGPPPQTVVGGVQFYRLTKPKSRRCCLKRNPLRPRLFVCKDGGSGEYDGWTLVRPKRAKVKKAKLEGSYI